MHQKVGEKGPPCTGLRKENRLTKKKQTRKNELEVVHGQKRTNGSGGKQPEAKLASLEEKKTKGSHHEKETTPK